MSICLFPSTAAILPRLLDDVFADLDDIDKALRAHSKNGTPSSGQGDKHSASRKRPMVVNDDSKLTISLDVKRFKPEDLKVNLEDRVLTVEGSQEIKEKDGYSLRSFVRQWNLPKDQQKKFKIRGVEGGLDAKSQLIKGV
ncbi:SHSP domain-containing protein [Trichostrongylus colubriformis]|uniref:SHSP domain-containing protein n=1 Tax=Trichostrongylus colubriformis TaxID=6319 RepID=A0AAN8IWE3_TRICO